MTVEKKKGPGCSSRAFAFRVEFAELRSPCRRPEAWRPDVLDGAARGATAFSARGALQADQTGRTQGHRRRINRARGIGADIELFRHPPAPSHHMRGSCGFP